MDLNPRPRTVCLQNMNSLRKINEQITQKATHTCFIISFRSIQNWWQIKKFYCFWFIFQVSIQLNVIHFSQILWVVWQMGKTMCLVVKGTMFLMFVKICVLESTQSKLMTFGHTCHVEPSLLQLWHASQRVLVSDVTWYKPLWHEPWGLPYKYVSQAGMQFSCHLDRNAGAHQKYIE